MKDYMYDVFFDADGNNRRYHECEDVYIDDERVDCIDFMTKDNSLVFRIKAYNPLIYPPMSQYAIKLVGFDGGFTLQCNGLVNQFGEVQTDLEL